MQLDREVQAMSSSEDKTMGREGLVPQSQPPITQRGPYIQLSLRGYPPALRCHQLRLRNNYGMKEACYASNRLIPHPSRLVDSACLSVLAGPSHNVVTGRWASFVMAVA